MTPLEPAWLIGPATLQADRPSPLVWRETSDGQIVTKLNGRKRTERQRGQRSAHIEHAEVDRKIAGLFDDLANLGLSVGIVARMEQDALSARYRGLRQDVDVEMVDFALKRNRAPT